MPKQVDKKQRTRRLPAADGEQLRTTAAKERLIEALHASNGVVSRAVKLVGIERTVFYRWRNEDPEFAQRVMEVAEAAVDFAESQLLELIRGPVIKTEKMLDGTVVEHRAPPCAKSIQFFLNAKGRARGYGNMPAEGGTSQPIQRIEVDYPEEGYTEAEILDTYEQRRGQAG